MSILSTERRRLILELVNTNNSMKIAQLAERFSTSELTIRRDLDKLDSKGLVKRTFGGAQKLDLEVIDFSSNKISKIMEDEKKRIGLAASKLVESPDVVFINSGTTTLFVAKALKNKKGITIVTNSIIIFFELRFSQDIELILLGGTYRPAISAFTGPIAEQSMNNIRAKFAFIGTDGLTSEYGVTSNDFFATPILKNMMRFSEKKYLVTDHTKFGKVGSIKYADITEFDGLFVDEGISPEYLNEYSSKGITIYKT